MVYDINVISVDGGGSQTTILLANLNSKLAYVKRTKGTSPNLYGEVGINRLKKNIISTTFIQIKDWECIKHFYYH